MRHILVITQILIIKRRFFSLQPLSKHLKDLFTGNTNLTLFIDNFLLCLWSIVYDISLFCKQRVYVLGLWEFSINFVY